jgi:hypothetical protein
LFGYDSRVDELTLLNSFERIFRGQKYNHRISTTGDMIASYLYEDLLALADSKKFVQNVEARIGVVNTGNQVKGKKGRRGDGTFGRIVPGVPASSVAGYAVARGPVANLEIGAEVKIVATKMLAQIDRVTTDLNNQAKVFRSLNSNCITVGIVGVNHASEYVGYEGGRAFVAKKAPASESVEIIRRLDRDVRPSYDEFLFLPYSATNKPPFPFAWVRGKNVRQEYASLLVRLSDLYDRRF